MRPLAGWVSLLVHGLVLGGLSAREPRARPEDEPPLELRTIELIELPAQPEVVAEPVPVAEPEPEPPEPEPDPAPEPEPAPQPTVRRAAKPEPAPDPEPTPSPEPAPPQPGPDIPASGDRGPPPGGGAPSSEAPAKPRRIGQRFSNTEGGGARQRASTSCKETPGKPAPREKVSPKFPAAALRSDIVGRLVLRASVDRTGAVTKVTVIESPGEAVEGPAKEAFARWRFEPATACGKPVAGSYAKAWTFKGGG